MIDEKTRDAVRTIGYLLDRGHIDGNFAETVTGERTDDWKDKNACKYCLSGATYKVESVFGYAHNYLYDTIAHYVLKNDEQLCVQWDYATPRKRKNIIKKLKGV